MANNFNLNAPEFVPKFGSNSAPNQNPPRGPGGNLPPGLHQQGYPQQQFYPQQQQQQLPPQFYQQQFRQPPPQHYQQQPYQQPYFYQQQQQQQQQFNSNNPSFNQQSAGFQQAPQQHLLNNNHQSQQQGSNQQANQQQASPQSEKVAQLANNLNKLSTSEQPAAQQPAAAVEPVPQADTTPKPATAAAQPPVVASKPVEPSSAPAEPSVIVEKSVPPSVAAIKEDEEWEDEEGGAGDESVSDKATEVKQKKQIVIREYKAKKEPINVIFCGHVDAGKSTIGGQIMYLTGMIDKRTLEKYEREAKEKNRESWYLSWALDTNMEEREKGKTVEVGRAAFETEKKHFIILDAPGHKGFVPNMIGGASQADIAVLVISARRGEFETGFERGGQTREHAMLVKTAGVKQLIVLVNKMDDPTVNWDPARYEDIKEKLTPYLKKCGFQPGKDTYFMPCSGYTGAFLKEPLDESLVPWFRGPCFIEYLDSLPTINRTSTGPLRMPIIDKYKDMGTIIMGKIESGMVKLNDKFSVMPNKVKVEVTNIYCEEDETDSAICGENVKLKLKGIEEEEISTGFVLCDLKEPCQVAKVFDAQVIIIECPDTCPIICPGFNSIMHIHAATVEVQLKVIIGMIDKKSGEKDLKNRPRFIKQDQIAICRFDILGNTVACMEPFKNFPQLGRFTLRCEKKTVAVGKVLKIIE